MLDTLNEIGIAPGVLIVSIAVVLIVIWILLMLKKPEHPLEPLPDRIILDESLKPNQGTLRITSTAFTDNASMPKTYTCEGKDVNPPLSISGVPQEAESLVLIMDDPDGTVGVWDHWVMFNIAPSLTEIREGEEPQGVPGKGTARDAFYRGPCPQDGEHRYRFKLYALDTVLGLPEGVSKEEVEKAMEGHVLDFAQIIGKYERGA